MDRAPKGLLRFRGRSDAPFGMLLPSKLQMLLNQLSNKCFACSSAEAFKRQLDSYLSDLLRFRFDLDSTLMGVELDGLPTQLFSDSIRIRMNKSIWKKETPEPLKVVNILFRAQVNRKTWK